MIVFFTLCYVVVLAILVWRKVLPNTMGTWLTTLVWALILLFFLFIPMQWGAPSGSVRLAAHTIQIIPNVAGPVLDVSVKPNTPVKKGDVLFTIDPTPFAAAVRAKQAQLDFQKLRLEQFSTLAERNTGTLFQVEEAVSRVAQLSAELQAAEWNLEQTNVRAPSDGFATTIGLRPGQRVLTFPLQPAMTFIDTSERAFALQIQQIYKRHLKVGQPVEVTLKTRPGIVFSGRVEAVVRATAGSQIIPGGTVIPAQNIIAEPFWVRVELKDKDIVQSLASGAAGTAAVYTGSATMTHIIRKVMIRMESYVNYVNPWL
ncbi:MAG: efflux RND transporter periplasmic adaptor subunit [Hoeflea sp.]|uniref:HlyD family secretion protein n=1 Tax=Hoeflea sp. TaxID=1940281 RepID=UPI0032979948